MTELYETSKFYRALVNALWYNIGLEPIKELYDKLKTCTKMILSINDIDQDWYSNQELNTYWSMFVSMFGNYGTSPRSGWIDKTDESLKFFEDLCNDLTDPFEEEAIDEKDRRTN